LSFYKFKVKYIKHEDDTISYEDRLKSIKAIAYAIGGEVSIHDPEIMLGITHLNDKWYFGVYERNNMEWQAREQKPFFYSNALGVRTARALVNIAAGNNQSCSMVDPCCGIGTVVMEALSLGFDIKGYEINPLIGEHAKKNLEFFGYEDVITIGDMHEIKEHFDAAIVDLPYGLFNPTTLEEQTAIMRTARRIADRALIITFEDMSQHIAASGFKIIDRCHVSKGKFKRYVDVCE
jgi:Predicted DNA modification methylase